MNARFTDDLWASIEDVYAAILEHPFVRGLTDGTLDDEAFRQYVLQDALYLVDYGRALAICAGRAPTDDDVVMFARHAVEAIEIERQLHDELFGALGIDADALADTEMSPTNRAYTSYLLAVAHGGSYAEALGAVLPCYWIYLEVGRALVERGSPDARFQRWIDTYADESFAEVVQQVIDATDRVCAELGPAERDRVRQHFITTSRYEWMFWDATWRREAWPV